MKPVIILSHFFPFPPQVGAEKRINLILRAISSFTEVVMIANLSKDADLEEAKKYCSEVFLVKQKSAENLKRIQRRFLSLFSSFPPSGLHLDLNSFKKILYSLPEKYSQSMLLLEAIWFMKILKNNDKRIVILDQHNLDSSVLYKRFQNAKFPISLLYWLDYIKQRNFEKKNVRRVRKILSVSDEDRDNHLKMFGNLDIEVVENCIDLENYKIIKPNFEGRTILFTGDFNYAPNAEGLNYFIKRVFPKIKREIENVKLIVAGRNSSCLKIMDDHLCLYGEFQKEEEVFSKATITIAPLLTGGGSRYKIIESLAFGIPVVSTIQGAEGTKCGDNGIVIARNEEELSFHCVKLLKERQLAEELGLKGRKFVEENYSFEKMKKILKEIFEAISDGQN
jgi:glycosyltransferase involved in cell wall biosynthesis